MLRVSRLVAPGFEVETDFFAFSLAASPLTLDDMVELPEGVGKRSGGCVSGET